MACRYRGIEHWKKSVLGAKKYEELYGKTENQVKLNEKYSGIGKSAMKDADTPIDALMDLMRTNYEAKVWDILRESTACNDLAISFLVEVDKALKAKNE